MLRDDLINAGKLPTESISVPGVKDPVFVRGLSASGRASLFATCFDGDGKLVEGKFFAAELVVRCVVDEDGKRVFTDEDAAKVGELSGEIVTPIFEAANRLSGLKAAEAEKNS